MSHASKEERKEQKMAKKRNCRRTVDEDRIHEKAVKLRKMTDEQLVNYVEDRVEKARSEGYNRGKAHTPKKAPVNIPEIIEEIGNVKGIGATKLAENPGAVPYHRKGSGRNDKGILREERTTRLQRDPV